MYKLFFKRIIDVVLSVLVLLLLSPVFIALCVLLTIVFKGSPFFTQLRPGKNEKLFRLIKFKTMTDEKDEHGVLLPDSKRLTRLGRLIRKTSLDEIPQLINVLKGDMSLIGPRPLLIKYLPYYTPLERKRHSVKPGITGLAQVSGRNFLDWDNRLAKDVEYVENLSFLLDLKIIWLTVMSIITSKNIAVDPQQVMINLDDQRKKQY